MTENPILRNAPPAAQRRYAKLAELAEFRPSAAIKLFCIQCMGWDYPLAKSCAASCCPMHALNLRIFRRETSEADQGSLPVSESGAEIDDLSSERT